jgi:predicted DsbA family dithiol-disulfide isomerase
MRPVSVLHFSDVLCVWAYVSQARVDELRARLGDQVTIDVRFCSVFGDARAKLATRWEGRGGLPAYGAHVCGVAAGCKHVAVDPGVWSTVQPASSLSCHVFLCAVRRLANEGALGPDGEGRFARTCWALREAFFRDARDVSTRGVQLEIGERMGLPVDALIAHMDDGLAHAELAGDYDLARQYDVAVSPTFILNDGRQRLHGNVSYAILEANVRELLAQAGGDQASAC